MFDFSVGEIVVIGAVALIAIGPKELPGVLRAVGQWTTKIRRMASEFQSQFQEALREAEMSDLKKEVDTLNDTAKGFTSQLDDPLNLKEATKWEPKADDAAKPADAPPPESPPVTPDGYAPPEAVAPAATGQHAAEQPVNEEDFGRQHPTEHPATEQPATEHHVGSATAEEPHPPPAPRPAAEPPLPEGSGQGGVHS